MSRPTVYSLSSTNGRGFRIRGTKLVAGPRPQFLCCGEAPRGMQERAQRVSPEDIAKIRKVVELQGPVVLREIGESGPSESDLMDELQQCYEQNRQLDKELGDALARVEEIERGQSEELQKASARRVQLEKDLDEANARSARLDTELAEARARIAELEGQQGKPRKGK